MIAAGLLPAPMKRLLPIVLAACVSASLLPLTGCEDQENLPWAAISPLFYVADQLGMDSEEDPIGPDLNGSDWVGFYKNDSTGERVTLTASISHKGESVSITTTKSGIGHRLTGTTDEGGTLDLTDAYDGEEWTSLRDSTTSSILVGDYTSKPTALDPEPSLQYIALTR